MIRKSLLIAAVGLALAVLGGCGGSAPTVEQAAPGGPSHYCNQRPTYRVYFLQAWAKRGTSCALAINAEYAYRDMPRRTIEFNPIGGGKRYTIHCKYRLGVAVCSGNGVGWVAFKAFPPGTMPGNY